MLLLDELLSFEQRDDSNGAELGEDTTQPGAEIQVVPVWGFIQKSLLDFSVRTPLGDVELDSMLEIDGTDHPDERRRGS